MESKIKFIYEIVDANCYSYKINNKVLLCSTGNYIQFCDIAIMEKNIKKNVYMCITESLCCTSEIRHNTELTVLQLK